MAKRVFAHQNWTPGATADNVTLNAGLMALKGGSATQLIDILEVSGGGLASVASPTPLVLAFNSTLGVTPSGLSTPDTDGPMHPATAALAAAPVSYVAAGTLPTRSSSASSPKLHFSFNAFGGLFRWIAAPGEEFSILGNGTATGEVSLSAYTGGTPGLMSSHIIYEPK